MSFAVRPNLAPPSAGAVISLAEIPSLISDTVTGPSIARAAVELDGDGEGSYDQLGGAVGITWYSPPVIGIGSSYWCRLTVNSGAVNGSSASTGVVLALTSLRTWECVRSTAGIQGANVTLQIFSDAGGSTVVASATFDLEAEVV